MLHAFDHVVLRLGVGDERADEAALQDAIEISSPRNAVQTRRRHDLIGLAGSRRLRWTLGERSGRAGGEQESDADPRQNRCSSEDSVPQTRKSSRLSYYFFDVLGNGNVIGQARHKTKATLRLVFSKSRLTVPLKFDAARFKRLINAAVTGHLLFASQISRISTFKISGQS